jgi:hypothetical protein
MLAQNLAPLVVGEIRAHYWQTDDRLVIRQRTEGGSEYRLVDAQAQSNEPLFDSTRLADLLSATTGTEVDADLALRDIKLDAQILSFVYDATRYELDLQSYLAQAGALRELAQPPKHEFLSPDGKQAAFIRDHNLWLRSTEDNSETQLTQDGARNYGYATNSAGWIQDPGPVLLWSPDSKKIATFRQDSRNVGTISLMETAVGRGEVTTWKYPLPGDEHVFMLERLVIHVDAEPRSSFSICRRSLSARQQPITLRGATVSS